MRCFSVPRRNDEITPIVRVRGFVHPRIQMPAGAETSIGPRPNDEGLIGPTRRRLGVDREDEDTVIGHVHDDRIMDVLGRPDLKKTLPFHSATVGRVTACDRVLVKTPKRVISDRELKNEGLPLDRAWR